LNIWLLLGAVVVGNILAAAVLAVDFVPPLDLLLQQAFHIP
jgi:hypothetical protein